VSLIGHVLIISVLKNHMKSFFDIIHEYTDIYAPLKTVHIPSKCIIREPCMTKGLLKSSITLSKMHKTNSGKSLNQQQLYKKYRNLYYMLIRKEKVQYYGSLLYKFKGDVSKTWRVLNSIIGKISDKSGVSDCFSVKNTK